MYERKRHVLETLTRPEGAVELQVGLLNSQVKLLQADVWMQIRPGTILIPSTL